MRAPPSATHCQHDGTQEASAVVDVTTNQVATCTLKGAAASAMGPKPTTAGHRCLTRRAPRMPCHAATARIETSADLRQRGARSDLHTSNVWRSRCYRSAEDQSDQRCRHVPATAGAIPPESTSHLRRNSAQWLRLYCNSTPRRSAELVLPSEWHGRPLRIVMLTRDGPEEHDEALPGRWSTGSSTTASTSTGCRRTCPTR